MVDLKAKMPEKTSWTNSDYYKWEVKVDMGGLVFPSYGGYGCAGFAMMASDAAFGNIPAHRFEDKNARMPRKSTRMDARARRDRFCGYGEDMQPLSRVSMRRG